MSARIDATPNPARPSEPVTLDASDSTSAGAPIEGCDFDVEGDGTYDVFGDEDCVITHVYGETGTFQPTVRVRNEAQETDTASTTLTVATRTVTETANQPPFAAFDYSPADPVVGEPVTFDGSASSDPDGEIVAYGWDFDDDGTIDVESGEPTTTQSFDTVGTHVVTLTVEDDDGNTAETVDEVTVQTAPPGDPVARCSVSTRSVTPGESVTIFATNSANAVVVDYDVDGDGAYERTDRAEFQTTVTYEEPGSYTPRVRVTGPQGQTDTADCGTIVVSAPNEPPVARFTVEPSGGERTVTLDGSASFDPDGSIVAYRWDFDGDGLVDATTAGPVVTHTYPSVRTYTVVLEVEDDDGLTDDTSNPVALQRGGVPYQGLLLVLIGLLGGLGLCRGLAWLGPFRRRPTVPLPAGAGVTDYAAGVVELPAAGGTVAVTDLDFEPDLVLLTASNAVAAGDATDQVRGTADGWSYGAARRTANGDIDQHVVAVADDATYPDVAVAAAGGDRALHLASHDGDGQVGGIAGLVEQTTPDGFELSVDAAGGPDTTAAADGSDTTAADGGSDSPPGDRPVVLYRAFELDSLGDVELGHFTTPTDPGTQSVDLGAPADHVTVLATDALGGLDEAETVDGAVGVSVGEVVDVAVEVAVGEVVDGAVDGAVGEGVDGAVAASVGEGVDRADGEVVDGADGEGIGHDEPRQLVTAGAFVPGAVTATVAAASDTAAIHLPAAASDGQDGPTRARATEIGDALTLEYEAVATDPETGMPAEPALVTYVAVNTGAATPALGHFALPSPAAEDDLAVDTGFAPGMVEFTVVDLAELGERTAVSSPFAFGRSHGVAVRTADGGVEQYRLNGAVDPDRPVPGSDDPTREVLVADAAGAGLAADGIGASIAGRDDVVVAEFRATGFDVRVTDVSTDGRDSEQGSDKLVCYKAWPRPGR